MSCVTLITSFLSLFFLFSFIQRNRRIGRETGAQIRSSNPLVIINIVLSTLIIVSTILATAYSGLYSYLGPLNCLHRNIINDIGIGLYAIGVFGGLIAAQQMQKSWRVGVNPGEKTELIRTGFFRYVRNPYFDSYLVMFIGLFLIRPSWICLGLIVITMVTFHVMVLQEERYLLQHHGAEYQRYQEITGRYCPKIFHCSAASKES